ncbi:MAG TPA: ParB/RepB/Spo0J family partition protein [Leptospiraceae bacterium]|nr:ParB/RepB/Spo0J family partition protein [Leptospiraceae bacterium]HMZ59285.1 ParB/RepB/Spo0J family partition protein [Leptospiraceae bacterium]HNF27824.1 ParB/RepB/Spo0J family partition protein [Leptospiraceae bacterium]HNO22389.1 ParB/RepB/Spo0J family partition protein [Leptospiraceae bacterium]
MSKKGKINFTHTKDSEFNSMFNPEEIKRVNIVKGYEFKQLYVSPNDLLINPENPYRELNKDDYERLKADISKRGIIDPLIIDEKNTLLTGHNRLQIAIELGLETVPVRKLSSLLSSEEKYRIMLLDNLNRRQLSPAEKTEFIKKAYGKEINTDHRGKVKIKPTGDGFKEKINTAEKISKETGMSKRQAERIISKIKSESKPKVTEEKIKPTGDGFKKPPKLTQKRERELNDIRSEEAKFYEEGKNSIVYQIRGRDSDYLFRITKEQDILIGRILEMNSESFTYQIESLAFSQAVTVKFSRLHKKVFSD